MKVFLRKDFNLDHIALFSKTNPKFDREKSFASYYSLELEFQTGLNLRKSHENLRHT